MGELRRIRSSVPLSLSDEALGEDDPRSEVEINEATDTEVVRTDIDLGSLDALVSRMLAEHTMGDTAIDRAMAIELHRLLPLTRREAADRHLWAWLGVSRYPHLVSWRWEPGKTGLRSPERFLGNRVRQSFARLWWAAELTRSGTSDYTLTDKLMALSGFQDVYEAIFGRAFCQYRPAMVAFVEVVGPRRPAVVREAAKEFGYLLTTMVLESMSEEDLLEALRLVVAGVESREGS